MSQNRIEQLIEELYEYIEGCKPKGFSTTQVVVMKDEIYEILDEMRLKIPEEIKQCAKVVSQKNQIIANAKECAEQIKEDARHEAEVLVQESEIYRQAYMKANEMMSRASQQAEIDKKEAEEYAETVINGALNYTNDMMNSIENVLSMSYAGIKEKTDLMFRVMEENLRTVQDNKRELTEEILPQNAPEAAAREEKTEYQGEENDEMYEIDSDAFLDNID